jgi:uncharacterized membrane protein
MHQLRTRPRLFIAVAAALAVGWLLPHDVAHQAVTRGLIAWNTGTVLYVVLAAIMMARSTDRRMMRRAQLQDEGQWVILALVFVAAIASLAAIGGELSVVKDMHGVAKGMHIALAGVTVLSSWAFIQTMFALHYAHEYYAATARHRSPGLQFPDNEPPGYSDFFYFSAIIGTSGQTADVSFVSKPLRRIGTLHCILAYLFNTTVLALLINIAASLL